MFDKSLSPQIHDLISQDLKQKKYTNPVGIDGYDFQYEIKHF